MAVFSVGALIYSAHFYHVKRAVALEQVRTRIAMDLHDDIGSGLSRMTILSEVVRRDIGAAHPQSAQLLAGMAETARGLVDSLGDIVWSIDPHKDDVSDLVVRVRQLAFDLFGAARVEWRLEAPDSRGVKLGTDERHQVFLILKEALTNIVKHSGCTQAQIAIRTDGECLRVEVRDNGLGLQANEGGDMSRAGNGLSNMKMRATQLGGRCAIQPAPSGGTVVSLLFPIKR
jgi:signal transduction histidine kinase